jgi:hypothetical protein
MERAHTRAKALGWITAVLLALMATASKFLRVTKQPPLSYSVPFFAKLTRRKETEVEKER